MKASSGDRVKEMIAEVGQMTTDAFLNLATQDGFVAVAKAGSLLAILAGHVTCTLLPDGIELSEGLRWSFTRTVNHEAERAVITNSVELMMRGYGVKEEFQKLADALNSD